MAKTQKYNEIFEKVLKQISPNSKRIKKVNEFLKKINKSLKKNKLKAKAVLGGSYAKGTWLKEDYDVDIFVKFDLSYNDKDISKLLEKALKKFKVEKIHGSRDYFQINGDINYEIIPVLGIKAKKDSRNVTDFSPLHVKWVKHNINGLGNDIRILKKFCKAQKVYGAESYINGFSGHVVDILVITYGGFLEVLKNARKWKDKQIIDKEKVYKGRALLMMNKSKIEGPLVLVDPVETERNAAAALSVEKFNKFKKVCGDFLKKPSIEFFEAKKTDFNKLGEKGNLVVLDLEVLKGKRDVIGSKILKVYEFALKNLNEFGILDSGWDWGGGKMANAWYVLKKDELDKSFTRRGPELSQKGFVANFKKKHKKTTKKGKHIYAQIKRKERSIKEIMNKVLKDKYATKRVKKCLMRS